MDEAFYKFENILREGKLRGGTGYIKGGYRCICFTETPISKLGYVLANPDVATMRYRPIGVMVDKKWVFEKGGRPVIYQPSSDFEKLPEELRYRHVCLELNREGSPVDLTWEREWRLPADELPLPSESTTVILPMRHWRDVLVDNHTRDIQRQVQALGKDAAIAVAPYPWHVIVLDDLGIHAAQGFGGGPLQRRRISGVGPCRGVRKPAVRDAAAGPFTIGRAAGSRSAGRSRLRPRSSRAPRSRRRRRSGAWSCAGSSLSGSWAGPPPR